MVFHNAREWDRNWYRDQMESIVPCTNVNTSLRQGQGLGAIVSYCTSPVPCTSPGPVQCERDGILRGIQRYSPHASL